MRRSATPKPSVLQAAAHAAIAEGGRESKERQRALWALGDYHRFATHTVWELGPLLVRACGISAGQRVLDVAAGTGNVAIRAAEAGAQVVAADLVPENFAAGRREARDRGVEIEWVEADAESLPFRDGNSTPSRRRSAPSSRRTIRRSPTSWSASAARAARSAWRTSRPRASPASSSSCSGVTAPPPPPGAMPPVLWGSEAHVRELFRDRLALLELARSAHVERSPGDPAAYCDFFKQTFGPVVGLYAALVGRRR